MADIPTLAPAADVELADGAPAPRKRSRLLLIIIVSVLVLAGGGAAAWYFMSAGSKDKGKDAKAEAAPTGPALYVALDPPFVTNFEADQAVRFLQITVQVMTHDTSTAEVIKANDPVIRNDLLMLFSNQKYADIASRDGKEALRGRALDAVRRAVSSNGGKPEHVEAVYFTSFVMQ